MMRALLRAFFALAALLTLLLGLPAVLGYGTWAVALQAQPQQGSVLQVFTRPDNGGLFLWALVVVGWIAWLAFAVSVLVEIPAQLRGRVPRHLPALGWSQRMAGGLVGAILALLPMAGGALAATGAPAPRLAVSAPLTPDFAAAPEQGAAQAAPQQADPHAHLPHYLVRSTRPAETLWGIAERTLGSGERWHEIAKLNEGRVMDAHHRVFDAERPIQPGWDLLLPRDAHVGSDRAAEQAEDRAEAGGRAAHAAHALPRTSAPGAAQAAASAHARAVAAARARTEAAAHADAQAHAQAGHAQAAPAPAAAPAAASHQRVVTVRPGDTLSAIAERELGRADAWRELFDANRGVAAPDGTRLTDPNLIEPGMRLTIPAGDSDSHSGLGTPAPSHTPPPSQASAGSTPVAGTPAGVGNPTPAPTGQPTGQSTPSPHATGPATQSPVPAGVAPGTGAPAATDAGHDHGHQHQSATQFAVAAGTSVLGAVLMGAVALRRSRRRTVKPGQGGGRRPAQHRASSGWPPRTQPDGLGHPPLEPAAAQLPPKPQPAPTPPAPAPLAPSPYIQPPNVRAAYPQQAQAVEPEPELVMTLPSVVEQQDERDLDLLGRALRSMARNVAREGRRLPPINVVRVTAAHTVELHLIAPSPPVPPFRAAHASTVWWCTPDAPGLLGPEAAAVVPSPYPALVSLGETVDGATVLVDLEAIRLLHLSGEPHDIAQVLRTLALELTFTPLADRVGVHVVGIAEELAAVADDRLVVHPDLEHAVAALQRRDASVRSALVQAGAATPREARSRGLGGDEWAPEVILCASYPTGDVPEALGRLLDARPRGSVAVITAAPPQGTGPVARWTLPAAGHGVVPGLEMDIQLQRLDDATYDHWLRLLGADLAPMEPAGAEALAPSWPTSGPLEAALAGADEPVPDTVLGARFAQPSVSAAPAPDAALGARFAQPPAPAATAPVPDPALGSRFGQPPAPAPDPVLGARFPRPPAPAAPAADSPTALPTPVTLPRSVPDPRLSSPISSRFLEPGTPRPMTGAQFPPVPAPRPRPAAVPEPSDLPPGSAARQAPQAPGPGSPVTPAQFPSGSGSGPGPVPQPSDLPAGLASPVRPASVPHTSVPPTHVPPQANVPVADPAVLSRFPAPGGYPALADPRLPTQPGPAPQPAQAAQPAPETWISALLATPPALPAAGEPELRVLGPVELVGAGGPVEPAWRATLVEAAARRQLGPAQGANAQADAIGRLRAWLGDDLDGRPVNLRCDWEDFQALGARGLADSGNAGDSALARALALVRGAPFAEAAYPWADPLRARMGAAVVDLAHELTLRRLRARDHRGAEAAAYRGLVAEPDAELLLRDLVLVHADAGDGVQLQRVVARLETKAMRTGVALEPETTALLDELRAPVIDPLPRR